MRRGCVGRAGRQEHGRHDRRAGHDHGRHDRRQAHAVEERRLGRVQVPRGHVAWQLLRRLDGRPDRLASGVQGLGRDLALQGVESRRVAAGEQAADDGDAEGAADLAVVSLTAEPTPALAGGSEPMIESVAGAIASPMPNAEERLADADQQVAAVPTVTATCRARPRRRCQPP